MPDTHRLEDATDPNEAALTTLVRATILSKGQYCLILGRCNYAALRERIIQRLREKCQVEIRSLFLPSSATTLYTLIKAELGDKQPQALMVFGLDSVSDLDIILTSTNQVREEFRKNFSFPLVLWINDAVLQKLIKIAPDFENCSTSVEFVFTAEQLPDQHQREIPESLAKAKKLQR